MTRTRHIKTLTRRLDFLRARLAVVEGRPEWRGVEFIRAEIASLEFALGALEDAEKIGLERLGRLSVEDRRRLRALLEEAGEAA